MADTNETIGDGTIGGTASNKPQSAPAQESLSDRLMKVVAPSVLKPKKATGGIDPEPVILEEHVVDKNSAGQVSIQKPTSAIAPAQNAPAELPVPKFAPLPTSQVAQKTPPKAAPAPAKPAVEYTAEDVGLTIPKPSLQSSTSLTPKPTTQAPKTPPATPLIKKPVMNVPPLDISHEKVQPSSLALDPVPSSKQKFVMPDLVEMERPKLSDTDAAAAMFAPKSGFAPPSSTPLQPPPRTIPTLEPTPVAPPPTPRPMPSPAVPPPAPPKTPVEPPTPAPVIPRPTPTPPPLQPEIPIPMAKTPAQSGNSDNDIQHLLSQVKLPERREFKAAADAKTPPPEPPKNFGAMVTRPPKDIAEARAMTPSETAPISSVHTLKDDLQHAVKEKKMSLVRAVALQQDKKRDELIEEEFGRKERRKRVFGILFASFLLFGLGIAAMFGVYFVMMSHSASSMQAPDSIVFAEQSVALPLDNADASSLKRRVAAARQSQIGSLGSITRVVPLYQGSDPNAQPTLATTQQFFTAMGFNAPDDLIHSLGSDFFFGLHVVDKNSPVMVIPVTNYGRAFAGMLAWEATMNADLSPAFTPVPSTVLDANGIPSARVFQDDVMRNYDVRELKDDSGNVELYYSFPSKNLLIIAESPYSFPELLSRLQSVSRL